MTSFILERDPRALEFKIDQEKKKNQEIETTLGQHWLIENN